MGRRKNMKCLGVIIRINSRGVIVEVATMMVKKLTNRKDNIITEAIEITEEEEAEEAIEVTEVTEENNSTSMVEEMRIHTTIKTTIILDLKEALTKTTVAASTTTSTTTLTESPNPNTVTTNLLITRAIMSIQKNRTTPSTHLKVASNNSTDPREVVVDKRTIINLTLNKKKITGITR
jgi:hypothetical protein